MSDIPLSTLFIVLFFLIFLSSMFSGSETALMTLNRYRMRHKAQMGHRGARAAEHLLTRPDRLIGLILLGNNFTNILASSIATLIALRLGGEEAVAIAAGLLTFVILIFAEVAPKTFAAAQPERIAYPAALIYKPLLKIAYPIVWLVNLIANGLLGRFGISHQDVESGALNRDELRTAVIEAGARIPERHQSMLLNIFDLEDATVEDIMVPRNEVFAINLLDDKDDLPKQITSVRFTQVPVYEDHIDNIIGVMPMRKALLALQQGGLDVDAIRQMLVQPYYVPEGTPLNRQLLNFQRQSEYMGLIVDEYGDLQGMVTLADILEEIVGEFTHDFGLTSREVHPQHDGSFLVDGGANLRDLNRSMSWQLPIDGPKTLSGLIIEYLEAIPEPGTSLLLAGYPVEIVKVKDNVVKTARLIPGARRADITENSPVP
ncbi:MAG TPA: HlyC/CorC family transporter [Chromatiaceae bacterium]|nr:HlyC/CorC family transporter [Chromatiaceae bacterium]HIA08473.1 HlyC/CorC family transporter [Chromatiaceae bacterium]HIN82037.1 HlyC/CorC family transporter [Chromatiales bacterium]HIO55317.1 HlyC/CorC family transporter [Chromatiales bacterium]